MCDARHSRQTAVGLRHRLQQQVLLEGEPVPVVVRVVLQRGAVNASDRLLANIGKLHCARYKPDVCYSLRLPVLLYIHNCIVHVHDTALDGALVNHYTKAYILSKTRTCNMFLRPDA